MLLDIKGIRGGSSSRQREHCIPMVALQVIPKNIMQDIRNAEAYDIWSV